MASIVLMDALPLIPKCIIFWSTHFLIITILLLFHFHIEHFKNEFIVDSYWIMKLPGCNFLVIQVLLLLATLPMTVLSKCILLYNSHPSPSATFQQPCLFLTTVQLEWRWITFQWSIELQSYCIVKRIHQLLDIWFMHPWS